MAKSDAFKPKLHEKGFYDCFSEFSHSSTPNYNKHNDYSPQKKTWDTNC